MHLSGGKTFRIVAKGASDDNKYIQRATLNGLSLDAPWISHGQLMEGGVLEFEMGPLPNKEWGLKKP
jgi:putative alpha-1,2-mannosidase